MIRLQGRVKFPTGGKVHDPYPFWLWLNWCNSSTDSKVWYKEDGAFKHTINVCKCSSIYYPDDNK